MEFSLGLVPGCRHILTLHSQELVPPASHSSSDYIHEKSLWTEENANLHTYAIAYVFI